MLSTEHVRTEPAAAKVLVVDDEPLLRRFAVRVLSERGYLVDVASDGAEALERIDADAEALDVVVSDIVMPRLNGVELLEVLSTRYPELPVVLMSGYGLEQLEQRGIPAPCAVLAKPFSAERLLGEVARCLRSRS
jgi:two-component system, cell cycle sensor histidine kinase and response regulator CckA